MTDAVSQSDELSRYRRLFDEAPIPYHEVDGDGVIFRVNRAECELLGLPADRILGRKTWDFAVPEHRAGHERIFRQAIVDGKLPVSVEYDTLCANGVTRTLAIYPCLIQDDAGRVIGVRSARVDVSARKLAERAWAEQQRLTQLNADLIAALARGDSLAASLLACCEAITKNLSATSATLWTCAGHDGPLELQASVGSIAPGFAALIKEVAALRRPVFKGLISAYPLQLDGHLQGILAMTSSVPLSRTEFEAMALAAQEIALGIERQRIADALRSSEAFHRRILETAAEGIWIGDREGRATFVNRRMGEILGCEPEDLLGRSLFEFIRLEDHASISVRMEAVTSGSEQAFEYPLHRSDGSLLWANICSAPLFDETREIVGQLAMFTDISKRKQAEDALKSSEEFNKSIVESAGDGILVLDTSGRFLFASRSAQWLLEIQDPAALIGKSWLDFWAPGDGERVRNALDNAAGGWSSPMRGTCRTSLGSMREIEVTFSAIRDAQESVSRIVAVVRDITERNQLEAQLLQALKLESIGQLAAGVAHEINTPIQYVGDNARFLQDAFAELKPMIELDRVAEAHRDDVEYLCEEIPKAVAQLMEGVAQVARIVCAMKEFSHPGPPEKTPVDLNRALQSTIMVSRNEWKYIADLIEDFDPELPPIHCVPGEINQVMLNLIVNAAHAIEDVVKGSNEKGSIGVSSRMDGDWVELRVSDTGAGIAESIRNKVFDPFFTTKEVGKGTGQGLSIAHTVVVKNHGGNIRFESEVGLGTTFIVRLPAGAGAEA